MAISAFDQLQHEFACPNPKCGNRFKQVLRRLLHVNEVICPKCGTAIDIREAKRTGDIGKAFDTANQFDAQTAEKK
jgi:hydrogenase maturation factor HypF (carbamoyltransferase family)